MSDSPTTAVNPDLIPDELKAILAQRPDGPRPPLLGAMNGVQPPAQMSGAAPMRPPVSATPSVTPPPDPLAGPRGAFDASNQKLQDYTTQMMGTQNKLGQLQPPSQSNPDLKPKWWDRVIGIGLGATQLKNPENAGAVAGQFVNRRFNAANQDYQSKRGALQDQLEAERAGLPALKDINEGAWRTLTNAQSDKKENFNEQYKSDLNDIKKMYDEGRIKEAQARLDETAEKNKDNAQIQSELAAIRDRIATVREKTAGAEKPATHGQFAGVEMKKAAALTKAHNEYLRAVGKLDLTPDPKTGEISATDLKANQDAHDQFNQAQQDSQDAYEAEIASLGGSPQHQDVSTWKGGAPAAQPGPATPAPSGNQSLPKAPTAGAQLSDKNVAAAYVKAAGGDKSKARELAKANGWKF